MAIPSLILTPHESRSRYGIVTPQLSGVELAGDAWRFDEPTTNLLPDPLFTSPAQTGGGHVYTYPGDGVIRMEAANNTSTMYWLQSTPSGSLKPGDVVTVSMDVRVSDEDQRFSFPYRPMSETETLHWGGSSLLPTLEPGRWERRAFTGAPMLDGTVRFTTGVAINGAYLRVGATVEFRHPQVEVKPYATPFTVGTRDPRLTVPHPQPIGDLLVRYREEGQERSERLYGPGRFGASGIARWDDGVLTITTDRELELLGVIAYPAEASVSAFGMTSRAGAPELSGNHDRGDALGLRYGIATDASLMLAASGSYDREGPVEPSVTGGTPVVPGPHGEPVWMVSQPATNLVPNPSAEIDLTNIVRNGGDAVVSRVYDPDFGSGDWVVKVECPGTGSFEGVRFHGEGEGYVSGGDRVIGSLLYRHDSGPVPNRFHLRAYYKDGGYMDSTAQIFDPPPEVHDGPVRITTGVLTVDPERELEGGIRLMIWPSTGGERNAHSYTVDDAQIEVVPNTTTDYATAYLDGDMGEGYTWTGEPHNSVSIREGSNIRHDRNDDGRYINQHRGAVLMHVRRDTYQMHNGYLFHIGQWGSQSDAVIMTHPATGTVGAIFKPYSESTGNTRGARALLFGEWETFMLEWDGPHVAFHFATGETYTGKPLPPMDGPLNSGLSLTSGNTQTINGARGATVFFPEPVPPYVRDELLAREGAWAWVESGAITIPLRETPRRILLRYREGDTEATTTLTGSGAFGQHGHAEVDGTTLTIATDLQIEVLSVVVDNELIAAEAEKLLQTNVWRWNNVIDDPGAVLFLDDGGPIGGVMILEDEGNMNVIIGGT